MSVATAGHSDARARTGPGPALPDVGVIALVPERWGGMWLSRHQVLTRLAAYFHVLWHNPARPWQQSWRAAPVLTHADPTPPPAAGFTVYQPEPWLPRLYRPGLLRDAAESARLRRARRALERAGCRRIVLYLWQPKFAPALDLVDHDLSCYHIADEYSFSDVEQPVSEQERRLIERVDQVFVHSPALMEKKGRINPHTAYVTNGVDYGAFAAEVAEPADLARVPRPRIGYIGRLKSQLDWRLLGAIARRRPDWSVVLVGPVGHMGEHQGAKDDLFGLPNVHYLGNKSVGEIPAYTRHMDVCLLCYALNDYTKYIFPLKLHEYLASGRPVVGSDIRSLRDFAAVVRIAHDTDGWCAAIEASLSAAETSAERVAQRRQVARAYDWNTLAGRIGALLCERLGGDAPARFDAARARAAQG
jgi:glycosyltransferase involved in cell wall biosynthesis